MELSSAVMADILKAQVGSVEVIRHLVAGRCDDFPALLSKVFKFLAREKDLSMRPGGALGLPSRCDPRRTLARRSRLWPLPRAPQLQVAGFNSVPKRVRAHLVRFIPFSSQWRRGQA